jgi:DNA (cytosine-5)-methyltransferase 1
MTNKKRVLSLFSGCGGMDLGFEGNFWVNKECVNKGLCKNWIKKEIKGRILLQPTIFQTVFANDILEAAEHAWKINFQDRCDVNSVFNNTSIVELVKAFEQSRFNFPDKIDVVTGGFPCQDFSTSGKRLGFKSHKNHKGDIAETKDDTNRGLLYLWMKKVVEITKPKIFVAENVKGLVSLGDAKEKIEKDFAEIDQGYVLAPVKVLNAKFYGVAQNRERVIFLGFSKRYLKENTQKKIQEKMKKYDPYPPITHGNEDMIVINNNLVRLTTLKQILKNLNEPQDEQNDLAQQSFSKAKYYGKVQGNIEINLDGVGPTIRAEHHGNIEFRRLKAENGGKYGNELKKGLIERRLTVRECARIQTFPDEFVFVTPQDHQYKISASLGYKIIGNAVPPLLGYNIAKRLEEVWPIFFGENE